MSLKRKFAPITSAPLLRVALVYLYFGEKVAPKELADHSLRMSVIDIGRSRRRGVVGHVVFPLRGHPVDSSAEIAIYQVDLLKETSDSISDLGELYISLVYNENSHRLTVSVLEARNLKFTEDRQKNSYVRVTLNQHYRTVKVKRTTTVRNSDVPKYSQGFTLNVPSSIIDMTSVILQVYQTGSPYGKDKEIGKVILGSYMFARGKPLTHWNTALANPMEQIQQWHPLCA